MSDTPDLCAAATLAALPRQTPARLLALVRRFGPARALAVVLGAERADPATAEMLAVDGLGEQWRSAIGRRGPEAVWSVCRQARVKVTHLGHSDYPPALAADPFAPAVLFYRGDMACLGRRRVGIVGTRRCTTAGRLTASVLGEGLAREGVAVVSGLARGIDAAAHAGVLRFPDGVPVGVVASGLDVVYPRENNRLWRDVADRGVLLSEAAPGTAPEAHRFPLRNRILAACSEALVVVESRAKGGSLITAREALRRDITVLAVPGPAGTNASEGSNLLLRDGAQLALDPTDILVALGLDSRRAAPRRPFDPRPTPGADDLAVLEAVGDAPCTLEQVVTRAGRPLGVVALSLGRLQATGWVTVTDGWFEAVGARLHWS